MHDTDDTRGLSQRELLLEMRQDIKEIKDKRVIEAAALGRRPTRPEIYGAISAMTVMMALAARFIAP